MLKAEFRLNPSKFYISLILLIFISSMGIVWLLPWPIFIKMGLCLGIAVYGIYTLVRYALLRHSASIQCLIYQKDDCWELITPTGIIQAQLVKDSTVTAWVSILRFQTKGRRLPMTAIVFRDSLKSAQYRQLIVTIKMG